ncbi:uncharacterized protein LOC129721185 [Wyeomyia smithii]|uniref:uncharacterized protein LOC129721185 n=1 Tax=Wyeomyia smithii TaxID=174621 RepID=UPI0024681E7F|nr:uncharacterized protein LOC129721185 [Wyeomyia smithii]
MAGKNAAARKRLLARANRENLQSLQSNKCQISENNEAKQDSEKSDEMRLKKELKVVLMKTVPDSGNADFKALERKEEGKQATIVRQEKSHCGRNIKLNDSVCYNIGDGVEHQTYTTEQLKVNSTKLTAMKFKGINSVAKNLTPHRSSASNSISKYCKLMPEQTDSNPEVSAQNEMVLEDQSSDTDYSEELSCNSESESSNRFIYHPKSKKQKKDIIECTCGQQKEINEIIKENKRLKDAIHKVRAKYSDATMRCRNLSDVHVSAEVVGLQHKPAFTEVQGFPNQEQLKKFSDAGHRSDYVFIKLLMLELWPKGLYGRSVTGRLSNNPLGRRVKSQVEGPFLQPTVEGRIALEPKKVEYIAERLLEHRLHLGDSPAMAKKNSDECYRLMARVISYYGKQNTAEHEEFLINKYYHHNKFILTYVFIYIYTPCTLMHTSPTQRHTHRQAPHSERPKTHRQTNMLTIK